uniref:Protein CLP1 homolog n=1 Tax=Sexangularia sp. CB-2014 TaxID=1486929 RepID=A0A7S1VE68_9EUKA
MSNIDESFSIAPGHELRLFTPPSSTFATETEGLTLSILDRGAEVTGTELPAGATLTVPPSSSLSILVPSIGQRGGGGVRVQVTGRGSGYVSSETDAAARLVSVHGTAAQARAQGKGPRIIIVGPQDVGKSTVFRTLLSYAARSGHTCTAVDLDVGQGSIGLPGTLGAVTVSTPLAPQSAHLDLVEAAKVPGFGTPSPLLYWYGALALSENPELYLKLVSALFAAVDAREAAHPSLAAAGAIINTCGWVEGLGFEILKGVIERSRADTVLVLGHERVYHELRRALAGTSLTVVRVPQSPGVEPRDRTVRHEARIARMRNYFYGSNRASKRTLYNWDDVTVCQVGGGPQAPTSALPIGEERKLDITRALAVDLANSTQDVLCAVSYATVPDEEEDDDEREGDAAAGDGPTNTTALTPIAGYVLLTEVDEERKSLRLVQPVPGALPGVLVRSNITYLDE